MNNQKINDAVIAVDLDGTLTYTDTLYEAVILLLKRNVFYTLLLIYWVFKGKAIFKHEIARRVSIDASLLPYNLKLIEWLLDQKSKGRTIILCTAANFKIAQHVAEHLKIFDGVMNRPGFGGC